VKRIGGRSQQEAWDYHTGRNDAPEFESSQAGRVDLARFLIDKILAKDLHRRPLTIVELGCGAGDVTGPYSRPIEVHISDQDFPEPSGIDVHGYDIVPVAGEKIARRYPNMTFHLGPVEDVTPYPCDILVMTEFLEHVTDPLAIVKAWGPLAKWMVVGHPLDEPDPPYEPGHNWSYTREDWRNWFHVAGHHWWEELRFPMAAWDAMVIGHGCRYDQPAMAGVHPDG
jgi:hypothetical protein